MKIYKIVAVPPSLGTMPPMPKIKRQGGRPKVPPTRQRRNIVCFAVSDDELARLRAKVRRTGFSVSHIMRSRLP